MSLCVSSAECTVLRHSDSSQQLPQRRRANDGDPHAQRLHVRLTGREARAHRLLQHLPGVIGGDGSARLKTTAEARESPVKSQRAI